MKQEIYSHWGISGTQEHIALLKKVEELYNANNVHCINKLTELAHLFKDELEDTYNITDVSDISKFNVELLTICDDYDLHLILDYVEDMENDNNNTITENKTKNMGGTIYLVKEEFNDDGNWMFQVYPASTRGLAEKTMQKLLQAYNKGGIFGTFLDDNGDFIEEPNEDVELDVTHDSVYLNLLYDDYYLDISIEEKNVIARGSDIPEFK